MFKVYNKSSESLVQSSPLHDDGSDDGVVISVEGDDDDNGEVVSVEGDDDKVTSLGGENDEIISGENDDDAVVISVEEDDVVISREDVENDEDISEDYDKDVEDIAEYTPEPNSCMVIKNCS